MPIEEVVAPYDLPARANGDDLGRLKHYLKEAIA